MNRSLAIRAIIILITLAFLSSCSDTLPVDDPLGSLMPLATGNQWIGKSTIYDDEGNVAGEEYDTLTVIEPVVIDNETWWRLSGTSQFWPWADSLVLSNRPDGLYSHAMVGDRICNCIEFRYPGLVGERFDLTPGKVLLSAKAEYQLIYATEWPVETTAGSFDTYLYKQVVAFSPDNVSDNVYEYLAPRVGPVLRQEWSTKDPEQLVRSWELVEYHITQ